jgi:hypothetical protein
MYILMPLPPLNCLSKAGNASAGWVIFEGYLPDEATREPVAQGLRGVTLNRGSISRRREVTFFHAIQEQQ